MHLVNHAKETTVHNKMVLTLMVLGGAAALFTAQPLAQTATPADSAWPAVAARLERSAP